MARPKSSHVRRRRETKEKLIAYRGKLVTVQEPLGEAPNGSGFVITLGAAPGLDATNLVVGRVVGGMELVRERFAALRSLRARQDPRPVTPVVSCAEILMWDRAQDWYAVPSTPCHTAESCRRNGRAAQCGSCCTSCVETTPRQSAGVAHPQQQTS